jgi:L-Ala-D/L-Glu epimerase
MIPRTTIRSLQARPLDLALVAPFGIAGGSLPSARNVLVTVELEDGTRGIGEGAPFPAFNGETQSGVLQAVEASRQSVEGADARNWRAIACTLRGAQSACARCAIETAILDALCRSVGLPLWAWFGGAGHTLETDMTVTTGNAEAAARDAAAIAARGMRTIKIKVGAGDVGLDEERVTAIAESAPGSRLLLDGNGGFTALAATALLDALRANGVEIELFEQPVAGDDWDGMREVAERGGVLVAADESVTDAASAVGVLRAGAAQVINVKLMKCGVAEALDIVAATRACGGKLMIGGMVESILAMSMSACFAAGLGGFDYADLDTPLFMRDQPLSGGFALHGDRIDVSCIERGHGVVER